MLAGRSMKSSNMNKKRLLGGVPYGTAMARLRKSILFSLVVELKRNFCHRCGAEIETEAELSIEHKEAWQQHATPREAFYGLWNISFSHLSCNVSAGCRPNKKFNGFHEKKLAESKRYQERPVYVNKLRRARSKKRAIRGGYINNPDQIKML